VQNSDVPMPDAGRQADNQDQLKTGGEIHPFQQVGVVIVKASANCRDAVKQWIIATKEDERQKAEIALEVDFICFYTHMVVRKAFGHIGDVQLQKLQSYLGPALTQTAIEAHYKSWPPDEKKKMADEFLDRLNEAEIEYSKLDEKGEILEVLMTITRHTLETLGFEKVDESKAEEVLKTIVDELMAMDIDGLLPSLQ
jgi:hypothetical protein